MSQEPAHPARPDTPQAETQTEAVTRSVDFTRLLPETGDPKAARSTVLVSGVAVAGFLAWAAIMPVDEMVNAQGSIMPEGFIQQVQHLEGGMVARVLVDDGVAVQKDEALVELDGLTIRAELAKAQARAESLRQRAERLSALAEGRVAVLTGDEASTALTASHSGAGAMKFALMKARLNILDAELVARRAESEGIQARLKAQEAELGLVSTRANALRQAADRGAVTLRDAELVQRERLRLEGDVSGSRAQIANLVAKVAEIEAQKQELHFQFGAEALEELSRVETERKEVVALIRQLEDRLERVIVRSPVDGNVHFVTVRGQGRVLRPGETVAEIVPNNPRIFAQVEIPAEKVGFLAPGMHARIKVTAYDHVRFGTIPGVVERIAPSSNRSEDKRAVFIARIRLERDFPNPMAEGQSVKPGMTVVADIQAGRKTVLAYLLKPVYLIGDRAMTER